MVKRTLKAFSLAEMIMAMVVIMIASVAALPALTQQKPNIPQTTIRGQYACWIYDGKHYEQRCEERACEDAKQKDCSFTLDSRPAHFFIAAVGDGGDNSAEQQVVLVDNPTISSDLKITITENQTIVAPGDSTTPVIASGSEINHNGLHVGNIEKCRLLTAGSDCPNGSGKQTGCNVAYDYSNINPGAKIEILGCTALDDYGNPTNGSFIDIGSFSKIDKYTYTASNNKVKVNFKLRDSMHTKIANNPSKTDNKKTFLKILESIPTTRRSILTDGFINNLEVEGFSKTVKYDYSNGAVLILW